MQDKNVFRFPAPAFLTRDGSIDKAAPGVDTPPPRSHEAITDSEMREAYEASARIIVLANLSDVEYHLVRSSEAKALGLSLAVLDSERTKAMRMAAPSGRDDAVAFSHDAAAKHFTEIYNVDMRFVAGWGRWLIWDGRRWAEDATMLAFDRVRTVCREVAKEADKVGLARALTSAQAVAAVERFAKADRALAATIDQWDTDPWLLNSPSGIVDLRTGQIGPHRPDAYMTKMAAVAPGGDCPLWLSFLERITAGDRDLMAFLQRVAGLSLTGITRDHALFFGYGTGANGKSVLIGTLTELMGDYASVATMDTFTTSPTDRHPTDLAMLRGARLVTAQETDEGRRWAESRIKAMTGGDPITARFMRQDFFTFVPAFKLFVAGNHKPALRGVDEALRRRFHLIPFTVTIPPGDRDPDLRTKLRSEWPGILAWAIEGCLEWQRGGLAPPAAVTGATADYLDAEDSLAAWLTERTLRIGFGGTETTALYGDWASWAKLGGEDPGSLKRFVQALAARGLRATKNSTTRRSEIGGLVLDCVVRSHHETAGDWD